MQRLTLRSLFVISFFIFVNLLSAQNVLNSVVNITVKDKSRNLLSYGTGIVIGQHDTSVDILTAFHVIYGENGQNMGNVGFIYVNYSQNRTRAYSAFIPNKETGDNKFDEELDIAIISAEAPVSSSFPRIQRANFDYVEEGDEVSLINGEGEINTINKINDLDYGDDFIEIGGGGVKEGFSGGPLLYKKKYLLGMMKEKGTDATSVAVHIDRIMSRLKKWGVQMNYLAPPHIRLKKATYILAGTATAGVVCGILEGRQSNEDYNTYKNNRDETAPLFAETPRDDFRSNAKKHQTKQRICYGVAVASVLTAVFINRKKLSKNRRSLFGDRIELSVEPSYDSLAGTQVGLRLTF